MRDEDVVRRERELGQLLRSGAADDVTTLVARKALAHAYYDAGRPVDAAAQLDEVLDQVVRLVGPDDPAVVGVVADLAHVWIGGWLQDRRPETAVLFAELSAREIVRILGSSTDERALGARNDLAVTLLASGDMEVGAAVIAGLAEDCAEHLGVDHALTSSVRENDAALEPVRSPAGHRSGSRQSARVRARQLQDLYGVVATVDGATLRAMIPGVRSPLDLPLHRVVRTRRSTSPRGTPCLEIVLREREVLRPLIVLPDDVLFEPLEATEVYHGLAPIEIADAPTLVAWTDLAERAEAFAARARTGSAPASVVTEGLLVRCAIAGGLRAGLLPLVAAAWWLRGWADVSDADQHLPPFLPDPAWAHLLRLARPVRLPEPGPRGPSEEDRGRLVTLDQAEFHRLAARAVFGRIDDELVSLWKQRIPITPTRFVDLLLDGLGPAVADVAVYPDGRSVVEVEVVTDGEPLEVRAFAQLHLDLSRRTMHWDEIRVAPAARGTGLFQRLGHNLEALGRALGVESLTVYATEDGAGAFAASVFPRDPDLYARVFRNGQR
jgi:hypothetical protein